MNERDRVSMETGGVHLQEPGIEPSDSFLRYLPRPDLFPILAVVAVVHGGFTTARPHWISDLYQMIESLVVKK